MNSFTVSQPLHFGVVGPKFGSFNFSTLRKTLEKQGVQIDGFDAIPDESTPLDGIILIEDSIGTHRDSRSSSKRQERLLKLNAAHSSLHFGNLPPLLLRNIRFPDGFEEMSVFVSDVVFECCQHLSDRLNND